MEEVAPAACGQGTCRGDKDIGGDMWWKVILRALLLTVGMLSALFCLIIIMVVTKTVILTVVSGLGIIYILYSTYYVLKDFLEK